MLLWELIWDLLLPEIPWNPRNLSRNLNISCLARNCYLPWVSMTNRTKSLDAAMTASYLRSFDLALITAAAPGKSDDETSKPLTKPFEGLFASTRISLLLILTTRSIHLLVRSLKQKDNSVPTNKLVALHSLLISSIITLYFLWT